MKKEKEQMLAMILNKPELPRKFSHRLIEQHINCMDPQDEDMRSFLWAYLSALTASESQVIYTTKIASLSENKRQKYRPSIMGICEEIFTASNVMAQ